MAGKINEKVSSIEAQNSSLKRNLEEMRIHIGQLNQQLEQEQNAVKQLRREKALEIKQVKEHEEQTSKVTINDLKAKLLNDKEKELANQREQLNRQHNTEINRISRVNDEAFKKYQLKSQKEKEEEFSRKKHELLADLKLNITRSFKAEKAKLLQEIDDLKKSKKHLDEELNLLVISDRQKATDIRRSYEEHLRELDQIRKEAKTDMRRLIDELKSKDRVIGDLEKELGYQSSYSQRLQLEKDSLGSLLNLTKMAESWEKRSPRAAMKKSRSLDLDNLTNEDSDKERRLQLRLTELNNTVRRLEDRNKQLMEGKSMESQLEQNPEKNKVLSKRLNDMEQSNKRLEEKSRLLELENKRLRTLKDQMRSRLERENKHLKKALNEEHASLKEEVSEVELLRAKLEQQARVIDRLKNNVIFFSLKLKYLNIIFFQNNTDLLSIDRKAVKSVSDEVSLVSDSGTIDEDDWNEFDKAELEANYQQLSKECLQLQKAYTQLQTVVGGTLDTQREAKIRRELESDLIESQATIESLQQLLIDSGRSVDWLKEKQKMQKQITKSNEKPKLHELEYSLKEVKDEKELLEFQLLETSEQDFSICSTDSPRASTPRILITQHPRTEEAGLHYACTLDQFNEIMYSELRQRLQALNSNKDFVVSKADSELLNQTLKMLDIA
ncbi:janus kinase and microtubule-interacting protein 1-like, partial [Antedon mediterranea]|uniref:janus kinase and microtubule-interacting protein 1-like n=1 Tax=Antedon mediterranea TaxID=105859 RepID=UPI003AF9BE60